ncbi:MAG: type II toxin-antitoxin system HicB family antitoxin [Faecalibacterium prausnitzii]
MLEYVIDVSGCFYKEDDGYSVIFPDLNYLATQGDSFEDAMEMAVECLASYLYIAQRDGEDVPAPSSLVNIDPVAVAKELDPDLPVGEAIVNLVSVDVAEYAKKHFEKSVKKTLSIPAWLNEAAVAQGVNFSQVLQRALKEQLHMA